MEQNATLIGMLAQLIAVYIWLFAHGQNNQLFFTNQLLNWHRERSFIKGYSPGWIGLFMENISQHHRQILFQIMIRILSMTCKH